MRRADRFQHSSENEDGRRRRAVKRTTTGTSKSVSTSNRKLTKSEIRAIDENGSPLWQQDPENYKRRLPIGVRILKRVFGFFLSCMLICGIVGLIVAGVFATAIYSYENPELISKLSDLDLNMSSVMYALDNDGNYVEYQTFYSSENRAWTSVSEMPKSLLNATIAIEDKRFKTHFGVDPIRTTYSVLLYVYAKATGGTTSGIQGGSTITQQLVKNITNEKQNTPERKINEMLNALYLERNYSKNQILEYYLNTVYFNNGCYGIGTAAQYYFGKEASDLTVVEGAAIIAITKSPEYYDPYNYPEHNRTRRIQVLYEMKQQGYISEEEYAEYKTTDLVLNSEHENKVEDKTNWSYAADMVFEDVVVSLMDEFDYSRAQAVNKIYTGGLKIYSTIDVEVQKAMEDYFYNEDNFTSGESHINKQTGETEYPQIAMEVMNPSDGTIAGVIGGRGKKTGRLGLNRATQSYRQSGSSIKPLSVYGYALENNLITQGTPIDDFPLTVTAAGRAYPRNFSGSYSGLVSVYTGLSYSLNTTSFRVLQMVGVRTSFDFASSMLGLDSLVDPDDVNLAPLAIGALTKGVTVQSMTAAFGTFASGGTYSAPRSYTKIENYWGDILIESKLEQHSVFTEQTCYIMTKILERVVNLTAARREMKVPGVDTVGKTGTSDNYNDRWFVGYTPYYVAGIWWGYDNNYETSSAFQTKAWGIVMNKIHAAKGYTSATFTKPDGVVQAEYCTDSGCIPCPYCYLDQRGSRVATGYFAEGTEPTEVCTMHHALYVCSVSGQIAHENCPNAVLKVFVDYNRIFEKRVVTSDAQYICPRLTPDMVLYNDDYLPVYYSMYGAETFPAISKSANGANTLCRYHTPSASPHIYSPAGNSSGNETAPVDNPEGNDG